MNRYRARAATGIGCAAALGCVILLSGCRARPAMTGRWEQPTRGGVLGAGKGQPILPGQIAALSGQPEDRRLVLIGSNGSINRLAEPLGIANLAWGPDGQMIAFDAYGRKRPQYWWLKQRAWLASVSDNSVVEPRQIACPPGSSAMQRIPPHLRAEGGSHPTWSGDGRYLALCFDLRIWVYDVAIEGFSSVTPHPHSFGMSGLLASILGGPEWSPNTSWIAFVAVEAQPMGEAFGEGADTMLYRLFIVQSDGQRLRPLGQTSGQTSYLLPTWSPDGEQLAFIAGYEQPPFEELTVADMTAGTVKTLGPKDCWDPAWSPDGKRIAICVAASKGVGRIATVDLATKGLTYLTQSDQPEAEPAWSPDGEWVAFARQIHDQWCIVADELATGKDIVIRSPDGKDLREPAWQPNPKNR